MITQDQLKDIATRIEKLKSYLEIDKKLIEIANEEEKTVNPDFWNDPKSAELFMKELRFKKKWVDDYNTTITLNEDVNVLYDFYKEGEVDEEEVIAQFLKTSTFLEDLEFKICFQKKETLFLQPYKLPQAQAEQKVAIG